MAHSGAMIALTVPDPENYALPVQDDSAVPPNELHITLGYLGEAADISPEQRAAILDACQVLADTSNAPEALFPASTGVFPPDPEAGDPDPAVPYYAAPSNSETFNSLREDMMVHLASRGVGDLVSTKHPVFNPHVTLCYCPLGAGPDLSYLPTPLPTQFSNLICRFGDEEHSFNLGVPEDGPDLPLTASARANLRALSERTRTSEDYLTALYLRQRQVRATPVQTRAQAALERVATLVDESYRSAAFNRVSALAERVSIEPDPAAKVLLASRALALVSRTAAPATTNEARELGALTASLRAIIADGNSSVARSIRAKEQLRDRYGRWIEEGGGVRFKIRKPGTPGGGTWYHGTAVGFDIPNSKVFVKLEDGRTVAIPNNKLEQPKAILGLKTAVSNKIRSFVPKSLGRQGKASLPGDYNKAEAAKADAADEAAIKSLENLYENTKGLASLDPTGGHLVRLAIDASNTEDFKSLGPNIDTEIPYVGTISPFKGETLSLDSSDIKAVRAAYDAKVASMLPEQAKLDAMPDDEKKKAIQKAQSAAIGNLSGLFNDRHDEDTKALRKAPSVGTEDDLKAAEVHPDAVKAASPVKGPGPADEEISKGLTDALNTLWDAVPSNSPLAPKREQITKAAHDAYYRYASGKDSKDIFLDNLDAIKEFANAQEPSFKPSYAAPNPAEEAFGHFAEDIDNIHAAAGGDDHISNARSAIESAITLGDENPDIAALADEVMGKIHDGGYVNDTGSLGEDLNHLADSIDQHDGWSDGDLASATSNDLREAAAHFNETAPATPAAPATPETPAEKTDKRPLKYQTKQVPQMSKRDLAREVAQRVLGKVPLDESNPEHKKLVDSWTRGSRDGLEQRVIRERTIDRMVKTDDPVERTLADAEITASQTPGKGMNHIFTGDPKSTNVTVTKMPDGTMDYTVNGDAGKTRQEALDAINANKKPAEAPAGTPATPQAPAGAEPAGIDDPANYTEAPAGSAPEDVAKWDSYQQMVGDMFNVVLEPTTGEFIEPADTGAVPHINDAQSQFEGLMAKFEDGQPVSPEEIKQAATSLGQALGADEAYSPAQIDKFEQSAKDFADKLGNSGTEPAPIEQNPQAPAAPDLNTFEGLYNDFKDVHDALPDNEDAAKFHVAAIGNVVANIGKEVQQGKITPQEGADHLGKALDTFDKIDKGPALTNTPAGDDLQAAIDGAREVQKKLAGDSAAPATPATPEAPPENPHADLFDPQKYDDATLASEANKEIGNLTSGAPNNDTLDSATADLYEAYKYLSGDNLTDDEKARYLRQAAESIETIIADKGITKDTDRANAMAWALNARADAISGAPRPLSDEAKTTVEKILEVAPDASVIQAAIPEASDIYGQFEAALNDAQVTWAPSALLEALNSGNLYMDELNTIESQNPAGDKAAVVEGEKARVSEALDALEGHADHASDAEHGPSSADQLSPAKVQGVIKNLENLDNLPAKLTAQNLTEKMQNGEPVTQKDINDIQNLFGLLADSPSTSPTETADYNTAADALDPTAAVPVPSPSAKSTQDAANKLTEAIDLEIQAVSQDIKQSSDKNEINNLEDYQNSLEEFGGIVEDALQNAGSEEKLKKAISDAADAAGMNDDTSKTSDLGRAINDVKNSTPTTHDSGSGDSGTPPPPSPPTPAEPDDQHAKSLAEWNTALQGYLDAYGKDLADPSVTKVGGAPHHPLSDSQVQNLAKAIDQLPAKNKVFLQDKLDKHMAGTISDDDLIQAISTVAMDSPSKKLKGILSGAQAGIQANKYSSVDIISPDADLYGSDSGLPLFASPDVVKGHIKAVLQQHTDGKDLSSLTPETSADDKQVRDHIVAAEKALQDALASFNGGDAAAMSAKMREALDHYDEARKLRDLVDKDDHLRRRLMARRRSVDEVLAAFENRYPDPINGGTVIKFDTPFNVEGHNFTLDKNGNKLYPGDRYVRHWKGNEGQEGIVLGSRKAVNAGDYLKVKKDQDTKASTQGVSSSTVELLAVGPNNPLFHDPSYTGPKVDTTKELETFNKGNGKSKTATPVSFDPATGTHTSKPVPARTPAPSTPSAPASPNVPDPAQVATTKGHLKEALDQGEIGPIDLQEIIKFGPASSKQAAQELLDEANIPTPEAAPAAPSDPKNPAVGSHLTPENLDALAPGESFRVTSGNQDGNLVKKADGSGKFSWEPDAGGKLTVDPQEASSFFKVTDSVDPNAAAPTAPVAGDLAGHANLPAELDAMPTGAKLHIDIEDPAWNGDWEKQPSGHWFNSKTGAVQDSEDIGNMQANSIVPMEPAKSDLHNSLLGELHSITSKQEGADILQKAAQAHQNGDLTDAEWTEILNTAYPIMKGFDEGNGSGGTPATPDAPSEPPAPATPEPEQPKPQIAPDGSKFSILPKAQRGKSGDGYFPGTNLWGKYGAAGIAITATDENGNKKVLIGRRADTGQWYLPGGALEEHETPHQGAARELEEEVHGTQGLTDTLNHVADHVYEHPSGWKYTTIIADSPTMFDAKGPDNAPPWELSEFKWVDAQGLADLEASGDLHEKLGNGELATKAGLIPGSEPSPPDVAELPQDATSSDILPAPEDLSKPVYDISGWTKTGGSAGTNSGGFYKDEQGNEYYVKVPPSPEHGHNEVLASALYEALGVNAAHVRLGTDKNGNAVVVSKMVPGAKQDLLSHISSHDTEYLSKIQQDMAVDALLGNYDVAGLGYENIVSDAQGTPVRIDHGGAMGYRAQGKKKVWWSDTASELDYLRNPHGAPSGAFTPASKIFGTMTDEDVRNSAKKLLTVSPQQITDLVNASGLSDSAKKALADRLVKRRHDILEKTNLLTPVSDGNTPTNASAKVDNALSDLTEAAKNDVIPEHNFSVGQEVKSSNPESTITGTIQSILPNGVGAIIKDSHGDMIVLHFDNLLPADATPDPAHLFSKGGKDYKAGDTVHAVDPSSGEWIKGTLSDEPPVDNPFEGTDVTMVTENGTQWTVNTTSIVSESAYNNAADLGFFDHKAEDNTAGADSKLVGYPQTLPEGAVPLYEWANKGEKWAKTVVQHPDGKFYIYKKDGTVQEAYQHSFDSYTKNPSWLKWSGHFENASTSEAPTAPEAPPTPEPAAPANDQFPVPDLYETPPAGSKILFQGTGHAHEDDVNTYIVQHPDGSLAAYFPDNTVFPIDANTYGVDHYENNPDWTPFAGTASASTTSSTPVTGFEGPSDSLGNEILKGDIVTKSLYGKFTGRVVNPQLSTGKVKIHVFGEDGNPLYKDGKPVYKLADAKFLTKTTAGAPSDSSTYVPTPGASADPSSPLYGVPKPEAPQAPESVAGPFVDDVWMEKANEAYKARKQSLGKPVKELSSSGIFNRYEELQKNGNISNLDWMLSNNYIDQSLYDDAKAQAAKVQAVVDSLQKEYEGKLDSYKKDIQAWYKANGIDPTSFAGAPPSAQALYLGGAPDWTKAGSLATPAAHDVFGAMTSSGPALAQRGSSFLADGDAIEDLDVRVLHVRTADGKEVLEAKFKMTAWAGDKLQALWSQDPSIQKTSGVKLMKRINSENDIPVLTNASKYSTEGTTFTWTDPETGMMIEYQRTTDGKTPISPHAMHNNVRVLMPVGSTPETFQKAMSKLGIEKAQPATPQDVETYLKNKIVTIFNGETDVTKNKTGANLESALDAVKGKYGITINDVRVGVDQRGRTKLFLSDAAAAKMRDTTNVKAFKHHVYNSSDVSVWVDMLSGPMSGLQNTHTRWAEGLGGGGSSQSSDMGTGGADYTFTKVVHTKPSSAGSGYDVVLHPDAMMRRLDHHGSMGDAFGRHQTGIYSYELMKSNPYEITWKDGIPVSDFWYVTVPPGVREQIIDKLKAKGIFTINGVPVENFVLTSGMSVPTLDPTQWSTDALPPATATGALATAPAGAVPAAASGGAGAGGV